MDAGSDEKRARVVLLHELAHAWMRVTGMPGVGGGVGALTPAQHEEARRLVAAGYTKASVARVLGVSRQAIGQLIKRIEEK
jgi:DNA-binding CsgD family transcriptional regulator